MNRYKVLKQLGDRTYGSVWKATNRQTNEVVAIKKMKRKFYSWEECMALREVKSLRKLNHPNVVKLKEVIRENDELYFVFEYMNQNLYQQIKDRDRYFSETRVKNWIYPDSAVHRVPAQAWILPPRPQAGEPPHHGGYGEAGRLRVGARDPFAPSVHGLRLHAMVPSSGGAAALAALQRAPSTSSPMGVIAAELFTLRPLFPGSSEQDRLAAKICSVNGTPNQQTWPEGMKLASQMGFGFPQFQQNAAAETRPQREPRALDFMEACLHWDPSKAPDRGAVFADAVLPDGHHRSVEVCGRTETGGAEDARGAGRRRDRKAAPSRAAAASRAARERQTRRAVG